MRQLIDHIQKSIYGPAYYQELLARPFSFSWKYFSALAFLLALFLATVLSVPLVPKVLDATNKFPSAFFAYYPDELEVRIDKGVASSNVTEPYFLPMPRLLQSETDSEGDAFQSLAVIDTATPFSMEQWAAYKTVAWLGKDQIAIGDERGGVRVETFSPRMDLVVNEEMLKQIEEKLRPLYKFSALIVVLGIFLGFLIGLGVNVIYLIFGAVFIYFLGRLMKQRWSYGAAYRIGLHAMTLPLLIKTLLWATHLDLVSVNFLFTAVMLAVVYVNFKETTSAIHTAHTGGSSA